METKCQECNQAWDYLRISQDFHRNSNKWCKDKGLEEYQTWACDLVCRICRVKILNLNKWSRKNSKTLINSSNSSRCCNFLTSREEAWIRWLNNVVSQVCHEPVLETSISRLLVVASIPNNNNFYSSNCKTAWMDNFSSNTTNRRSIRSSSTQVLQCRIKTVTTEGCNKMYIQLPSMCPPFDNNRLLECNWLLPMCLSNPDSDHTTILTP